MDDQRHRENTEIERVELNLSHRHLEALPDNGHVFSFNPLKVTSLILQGNIISVLPDSISNFKNLVHLDVSSNGLAYISARISELDKLLTFIGRNNNLDELPKEFGSLAKLEKLNLSGNRLESFGPSIFRLTQLKVLLLGGNKINNVPPQIYKMKRLEILYLGGNSLLRIPPEVGQLRTLRALYLCDNKLESIPSTLTKLSRLRSLSLHNNRLTTLPVEIVKLKNLEELSLRDNPLVVRFVRDMAFKPPSLLELSGRCIKNNSVRYSKEDLPPQLLSYLNSARRCVNPCCKGVYFDARVRNVRFVDFCGKYRLPLEQYLCSPHENYRPDDGSLSCGFTTSSDEEENVVPEDKMKKVLLG
ncbi:predicted protein [Nematostella vectensis]|uniref:Leucine-rich repeat-containing protein 58 n=1 Tax=Nematostella vectensis TaxID=45351 RepID=A7SVP7_NEMVE|nr:leucine-rich repeat-containing protein 58 [Nematostella vectensis]EDO32223.1 predicted protein [Nematostella vectensis]|eukprot:XP_001624323.1 predicted protein [Nematostella vectensis]